MFMKMKSPMAKVPIEGLDEEDSLRIFGGNIFNGLGIQQFQPNRIKRIHRIVAQQLIDRPQLARLHQPTDCMVLISDNDAVTIRQSFVPVLGHYDAWFRGDRSYCLILYRSAL